MKFGRSGSTQSYLTVAYRLILLAGILALMPVTESQSAPDNIEELVNQFNEENGIVEEVVEVVDVVDDYGIATYDKSRTQFDGVTHELQVTYLKLSVD